MDRKYLLLALPFFALMLSASSVIADNITVSASVNAGISAVFNFSTVSYGNLNRGTSDNAAPDQADGVYNVTIGTNKEFKVSGLATQFSNGGHTFNQNNLKVGMNQTAGGLAVGDSVAVTGDSQDIETDRPATETDNFFGFWLTIPSNQYATAYSSTLTLTYANV